MRIPATLVLLGALAANAFAEERNWAEVIAYRAGSLTAPLRSFTLLQSGQPVLALTNGSYVTLQLSPGMHQFGIADHKTTWSRTLEADTRYYLRLGVSGSNLEPELKLEQAVPATAKAELEGLRELELEAAADSAPAP